MPGIPDRDIYPNATGEALKTVQAHEKPEEVVLYAGWFCPYVQRTWMALEEKGIPYQYKEENPYMKDPEFLKLSPKGLVPALVYKGQPIHESLVINEFLEDAFPHAKPLLPKDPVERAHVRIAIDHVTKSVIPAYFKTMQSQEKAAQEEGVKLLYQVLDSFADRFKGNGPFFLGERISLADLALIPWVGRLYIVERHRGFKVENTGARFQAWARHVVTLDIFKKTTSNAEHYEKIYGRYLRDEAQSEAAKATRKGEIIP